VRLLLDAGADVEQRINPENNRTAVQAAADAGSLEVVKLPLQASADVNARPSTRSRRTALQAAAQSENAELVTALVAAGAHVNTPPLQGIGAHCIAGSNRERIL
jgi:ankyrin repeat protein